MEYWYIHTLEAGGNLPNESTIMRSIFDVKDTDAVTSEIFLVPGSTHLVQTSQNYAINIYRADMSYDPDVTVEIRSDCAGYPRCVAMLHGIGRVLMKRYPAPMRPLSETCDGDSITEERSIPGTPLTVVGLNRYNGFTVLRDGVVDLVLTDTLHRFDGRGITAQLAHEIAACLKQQWDARPAIRNAYGHLLCTRCERANEYAEPKADGSYICGECRAML